MSHRLLYAVALLGLFLTSGGCAICASPHDYGYPSFGGRWQRADREHGRVGSAFAPAEGHVQGYEVLSTPLQTNPDGSVGPADHEGYQESSEDFDFSSF